MKTLKKLLDQLIYSLNGEHSHKEPVPAIFKDRPLIWTPLKTNKV